VIIFDADHTVIDYLEDEKAVLRELLPTLGIEPTEETVAECDDISNETWEEAGLNAVHTPFIQENYHKLYVAHTEDLFKNLFRRYPSNADPKETGLKFLKMLERPSIPCEGAVETLKTLHGKYTICVATNAVSSIQRPRMQTLSAWVDRLYISEEMSFIKPMPPFFSYILKDLGVDKSECLMVGDSLSSDVAGANASGMDSCWLNRKRRVNDSGIEPTYEIHSLQELLGLLGEND
jgi:2-haloacid dehalogenase